MSVSKVTINGATQMDLTQDTVDAENLMTGYTAHAADGSAVTGTHVDGGGAAGESGALFIDYDGTELYSYTTAQALALTALPANPTHTGLTAQGWNWSLENIQSYLTEYPDGLVIVGQMYITDDGKTRIYIHLGERRSPKLGLVLYPNSSADIDWGDGTTHDTLTSTASSNQTKFTPFHNYASSGDYIIKITVISGKIGLQGSSYNDSNTMLLRHTEGLTQNIINNYYAGAINKVEIGANVERLYAAFDYCYNLESITIPNTVTVLGEYNFKQCLQLKSVTIPKSSELHYIGIGNFSTCESIRNISIPDSITSIDNDVFYTCRALKRLTIPKDVTYLGTGVFEYCRNLKYIKIPDIQYIPARLLNGCLNLVNCNIPETINAIQDNAFAETQLSEIIIPDGVTTIGIGAFSQNKRIKNISIPNSVTSIGYSAFTNCNALESIELPSGLTAISNTLFYYNYALKNVTIPNGVTSIGNSVFCECHSLQNINIPDGVTTIGSSAFEQCKFTNINIPNTVTSIGSGAFNYCTHLESVNIPDAITNLYKNTFNCCYNLKSIIIPNGVTGIGQYCFNSCYSLTSITIPAAVTSIGNYAFGKCSGMKEYHLLPTTPPTVSNTNAFQQMPTDCIIYVPYSADHSILTAYQAATNWSTYASQMQEEPQ